MRSVIIDAARSASDSIRSASRSFNVAPEQSSLRVRAIKIVDDHIWIYSKKELEGEPEVRKHRDKQSHFQRFCTDSRLARRFRIKMQKVNDLTRAVCQL